MYKTLITVVATLLLVSACTTQPARQPPPEATPPPAVEHDTTALANSKPQLIQNKTVIGEVEQLRITPPGIALTARIDTGATTTSVHAEEIVPFERDGEPWVSFVLRDENGAAYPLKRELSRIVEIKRHGTEPQQRPVVKLRLQLGQQQLTTEVSLTDRSKFTYKLLIGRNFLRDFYIVDVSGKELIALPTTAPSQPGDQ